MDQGTGMAGADVLRKVVERHGGVLHRLVHIANRVVRPMTMGVRAVVLDAEGRVFLVRHSYVPGWHLPGGGVEPGETVLTSLARELEEEGNIRMTAPPVLHGVFFNDKHTKRDHVVVYVVRAFEQTGTRRPDWEIVETGFFDPAALPQGTSGATRRRLAELAGGEIGERW